MHTKTNESLRSLDWQRILRTRAWKVAAKIPNEKQQWKEQLLQQRTQ
jgi:hypothetical protein